MKLGEWRAQLERLSKESVSGDETDVLVLGDPSEADNGVLLIDPEHFYLDAHEGVVTGWIQ